MNKYYCRNVIFKNTEINQLNSCNINTLYSESLHIFSHLFTESIILITLIHIIGMVTQCVIL